MKIIMISSGSDTSFFREGSPVRERMKSYSNLVEELHVIVFTPKGFEKECVGGNLFLYPTNSSSKLMYVYDALCIGRKIISKIGVVDTVVTTQDPFEAGIVGMFLAKKYKIPLEVQIHTDIYSKFFKSDSILNRIRLHIGSIVLPYAKSIRVVSKRIKDSLVKLDIEEHRIKVLPIVVGGSVVKSGFNKRAYPQFDNVVLMVSRLEKEKDVDSALDSFASVLKDFPKTGLVIVGDGSMKDILKRKASHLGIGDSVLFEGWQDHLERYYAFSDVFLNTSLYEGYARTLVEASTHKLPIVTTDVGLVGDVLTKEEVKVCPVGDVDCLGNFMKELLGNNEQREDLALRASEKVSSTSLSEDQYLESLKDSWRSIMD